MANGFIERVTKLNLGYEWPVTELLVGALGGIAIAVLGGMAVVMRDEL